ncbi:MAG: hypothetical protein Q9167_000308 [Letrouitia subvulpina]
MNNTEFRKFVLETPQRRDRSDAGTSSGSPHQTGAKPSALGSRMRSSIPMTPRSITNNSKNDFARQLAERNAAMNPQATKKFRSTAAPKGTKLGSGYTDRTLLRKADEEDEKTSRIKALEEMVKLGQMEWTTFEALRDEIVGGDINNVHLVKGLDRRLLERARRGEDVFADIGGGGDQARTARDPVPSEAQQQSTKEPDVDDEFDKLEGKEVQPLPKQQKEKKGELAPPPPVIGKKRNRDEILKELKASRQALAEKPTPDKGPSLGSRFLKIGEKREISRREIDAKGREVLITVDAEGNQKRKVRKPQAGESAVKNNSLPMPDKNAKPLGMDVPVPAPSASLEDDNDGDIFEGVGRDYDPFAGAAAESDDDSSEHSQEEVKEPKKRVPSQNTLQSEELPPKAEDPDEVDGRSSVPPSAKPQPPTGPRNYFGTTKDASEGASASTAYRDGLKDPTILAALKKAASINPSFMGDPASTSEEAAEKLARRKRMLESHDRDAEDMDLGFGSSRFEDAEEGEDRKVKLSVWGTDGGDQAAGEKGKSKRKRGPKKRKGDKDSAADVLKVLERNKKST